MKILTVIGARPQFIKAAAVSRIISQQDDMQEVMLHTGQHYDQNMSDIFFEELELPTPSYQLAVGSGLHGAQTGQMLYQIEEICLKEQPDFLLIYGDTNSTLAGALAASKLHIRVAHVEAGLRSYNRRMPEEINRVMADHLSSVLFAPTDGAVKNLQEEGVERSSIHQVGDVMYDAALYYGAKAEAVSDVLARYDLSKNTYLLATIHRAENTDDKSRLKAIFDAFIDLSNQYRVILPLHPRTKKALIDCNAWERVQDALQIIEPQGFLEMLMLERNARLIMTDSGGVQKEAFFCRIPCATLRDETEWVKLLELGWNTLVPPASKEAILTGIKAVLAKGAGVNENPYGQGDSAQKIVTALRDAR